MAFVSAFLSSSFTFSASETLKTSSVLFNLRQFRQSLTKNKASDLIFTPQVSIPVKSEISSVGFNLHQSEHNDVRRKRTILCGSAHGLKATGSGLLKFNVDPEDVPLPILVITRDYDHDSTMIKLSYGGRYAAFNIMMDEFRDLGLFVFEIMLSESDTQATVFIKELDTMTLVEASFMLEAIRDIAIRYLFDFDSLTNEQEAMEGASEVEALNKLVSDTDAVIIVKCEGPLRSLVYVETEDWPGEVARIMEVIAEKNIDVNFAEIVTDGQLAKDEFHVSYKGRALEKELELELEKSLRSFLQNPGENTDSS